MLFLIISITLGVWVLMYSATFMDTVVNGDHIAMAILRPFFHWQVLHLNFCGRFCCQHCCCSVWKIENTVADVTAIYIEQMAGVIANVGDGIAT